MTFQFSGMGPRNFERIAQALAFRAVGQRLVTFGEGPDGGREATWDGKVPSLSDGEYWDGFAVLQAKLKIDDSSNVAANLTWLTRQVSEELRSWAAPDSKRERLPEYFLFVTNVRLSPGNNGGKAKILREIEKKLEELKLSVKGYRVWDFDDLNTRIDADADIRRSFRAWITPGDVLEDLIGSASLDKANFRAALRTHAVRTFRDDSSLNLRQAGSVSGQPVTMGDVFIDLPSTRAIGKSISRVDGNIVASLVAMANDPAQGAEASKFGAVVVGGPGQGKSTATQFLAQLYRAAFLKGGEYEKAGEIATSLRAIKARAEALELPAREGRRWPIRVILTELADALSARPALSLVSYIAERVSDKGSRQVSGDDLLTWLAEYPWILIVDGLDEVPNSSNRTQVMDALSDFFIEAQDAKADLLVVATTRPQGYSGEFSAEKFVHFELSELPTNVALVYAKSLVDVRLGRGTAAGERIIDRLEAASGEKSTSKLFGSPLQVAILTILVETLGHVPKDRWKLFSNYYRVISQREQEKGGELAQLLQDYASDVDQIHRHVGNLLQVRSAEAGETSSFLTREEFEAIVEDRLRLQGHSESEIVRLSGEFARLSTERLVFLAKLTSERVGFEIRSLQEFMAGEYLLSLPDEEVIAELETIVDQPHWRNTVLFAVGCIFATKEHLKAEVPVLCEDMGLRDPVHASLRTGSDLALDILLDGAANTQPRFARMLARIASDLISGPITSRHIDLASLDQEEIRAVIQARAEEVTAAAASQWINRVQVLDALESRSRVTRLADVIAHCPADLRATMVNLAWATSSPAMASAVIPVVGVVNPSEIIFASRSQHESLSDVQEAVDAPWFTALDQLFRQELHDSPSIEVTAAGNSTPLEMRQSLLGRGTDSWETLAELDYRGAGWDLLQAVGSFVEAPTTLGMSNVLQLASQSGHHDLKLLEFAPWVIRCCVENARYYSEATGGGPGDLSARLAFLATCALEGRLGDETDWVIHERQWTAEGYAATIGVSAPRLDQPDGVAWDAPVWPSGLPSNACGAGAEYVVRVPSTPVEALESVELTNELIRQASTSQPGAEAAVLTELSFFVAATLRRDPSPFSSSADDIMSTPLLIETDAAQRLAKGLVRISERAPGFSWAYGRIQVLSLLSGDNRDAIFTNDFVSKMGEGAILFATPSASIADSIVKTVDGTSGDWLRARVALHFDSSAGLRLSLTSAKEWSSYADHPLFSRFNSYLQLGWVSGKEVAAGAADAWILDVCGGDGRVNMAHGDSINSKMLLSLCRAREKAVGRIIAVRASQLLDDRMPYDAERFISLARRL